MVVGSKLVEPCCAIALTVLATGCTHTTLIKVKQPTATIAVDGKQVGTGTAAAMIPNGPGGHFDLEVKQASHTALHATIAREVYSQPAIRGGLALGVLGIIVGPVLVASVLVGLPVALIGALPGATNVGNILSLASLIGPLIGAPLGLVAAISAAIALTVFNLNSGPEEIEVDLERNELTTRPAVRVTIDREASL